MARYLTGRDGPIRHLYWYRANIPCKIGVGETDAGGAFADCHGQMGKSGGSDARLGDLACEHRSNSVIIAYIEGSSHCTERAELDEFETYPACASLRLCADV